MAKERRKIIKLTTTCDTWKNKKVLLITVNKCNEQLKSRSYNYYVKRGRYQCFVTFVSHSRFRFNSDCTMKHMANYEQPDCTSLLLLFLRDTFQVSMFHFKMLSNRCYSHHCEQCEKNKKPNESE